MITGQVIHKPLKYLWHLNCISLFLIFLVCSSVAALTENSYITESNSSDYFTVSDKAITATIYVDNNDFVGVQRAVSDLQSDIKLVTGKEPVTANDTTLNARQLIIIGTVGRSQLLDTLINSNKLDVTDLKGKWESFVIETVNNPIPNVDKALVIAGSDKRGTIYGIYDLSENLGVSPWYWWADVPVKTRNAAYVVPGRYFSGEPKVKYRGIFINDEEPCFGPWAREKFGGINSKMYAHMYELILRLRGNYLWPAMWGKSIYEDDPESARLADEYGIVLGTTHHEPMTRAHADWSRHKRDYGNGQWNYATNEEALKQFWTEGVKRNKDYETLISVGMRGDGDEPMVKGGDIKANIDLLEKIIADQRKIISDELDTAPESVPQLWALYKEVKDYYDHGMTVPDDITLFWCDDNWGNNRRLPTEAERKRSGGAGIYYHFDYVGSPRSYKWINTNPLPKIWQQMTMAYEYGADMVWVVNVGDLKPMELPIEFFLNLAWDPELLTKDKISVFTHQWAKREFGATYADSIADIVSKYAKYNGWRKPELLEPGTFSLINFQEAEQVLAKWQEVTSLAEEVYANLPPKYLDAYYQLVLYPTKASAVVAEMYIAAGRNQLYAEQGRMSANNYANRVKELFNIDRQLTNKYHKISDGKWNHMMAQTHIGFTSWSDPRYNIMPKIKTIEPSENSLLGVAIEGAKEAWPGSQKQAALPKYDSLNCQQYWIDIFNRGQNDFDVAITANQPWVILSDSSAKISRDKRIWVSIDWDKMPYGQHDALVNISYAAGNGVQVQVSAFHSEKYTRKDIDAFGGLAGPIAICAGETLNNIAAGDVQWEKIPDYGRGPSGMTIFPVTAASVNPPKNSPCLEYRVFIPDAGKVYVDLITGVALKTQPDRGVRIAVSFDDNKPNVLDVFADQNYADPARRGDISAPPIRNWANWVRDNAITLQSENMITGPGVHTLKIWMVDPGIVLEKIIIHNGNLPKSYFGPPASNYTLN